jgi:ribosomal protein S18 acetylase RimI-like enzyme
MSALPVPKLRSASPGDATAIAEIKIAAWRVAYRGIVPDAVLDRLDVENVRDKWLAVRRSELADHGIVALESGHLSGYALFGPARHQVEDFDGQLFELYVLPSRFGSGLATHLLDAALGRLNNEGRLAVMLWVFEANLRARRFYEKHRWTRIQGAEVFDEIGEERLRTIGYGFRGMNTLK